MNENEYIAGIWSGHDCSYFIMDHEGQPVVHNELERFNREKEPSGNSLKFLKENFEEYKNIKYLATCWPFYADKIYHGPEAASLVERNEIRDIVESNGGGIHTIGHHESHALNAFYSSNLDEATIITIDGGGIEDSSGTTCSLSVWIGKGTEVKRVGSYPTHELNVGGVWTRVTRYIFGLQSGWPTGHQAGTVMAMAALGDGAKYFDDFYKMLAEDHLQASMKPHNQPKGANVGTDPVHPYLNKYKLIAESSDEEKYNLAASMQLATEEYLKKIFSLYIDSSTKNLCLSGGVILNSVFSGKLWEFFPQLKNIYVTPTPHDGGLCIGAAQHVWHNVLGKPRNFWEGSFTPYLGETYSEEEVAKAIVSSGLNVENNVKLDKIVDLLEEQKIISVFSKGSESGRRALGNRSILADPRSTEMKDKVNEKVKHRQWFRPFAPSILRQEVSNWFVRDVDSPYMSFCIELKEEAKEKVPAINHFDNTARLQTVTRESNENYFNLLSKWFERTGCPILLNTSFNDREPICETPEHAVNCYKGTDIDYLYFSDYEILVSKK
tara:strand:+ start:1309 stop:2964 length:1656 start_codon:yes stop_codon:yes gene_type:complete